MMTNHIGDTTKDNLLAAGGILGAIGASSCCLLPLVFALTGISGAWIGFLTKFAPYQPFFLATAGISVGLGLWRAYGRQPAACAGPRCGTTVSRLVTRTVLWVSAALTVIAATTAWWVQLLA